MQLAHERIDLGLRSSERSSVVDDKRRPAHFFHQWQLGMDTPMRLLFGPFEFLPTAGDLRRLYPFSFRLLNLNGSMNPSGVL